MTDTTFCDNCGDPQPTPAMHHFARLPVAVASANAGESASLCDACTPDPWINPTNTRFIPPVVMNPATGADYDTLLTVLNGWVVQVHLLPEFDDGREHIGVVRHDTVDAIHLTIDDEHAGHVDEVIDLAHVRWLQIG